MQDLSFFYPIAFIFVLGVLASFVIHKLKLPSVLFLLLTGIAVSKFHLARQLILFPRAFVVGISVIALVMITYDVFSRIRLHQHDVYEQNAVQLTSLAVGLCLLFLGMLLISLKVADDPIFVMVASSLIAAVSAPFVTLHSVRVRSFMNSEACISSAIVLFLGALLLHFVAFSTATPLTTSIVYYMTVFSLQIMVGLGAGLLLGLVVFRIFRNLSRRVSPLALLAIALGSYFFAEVLNGAGLFAVMTLALLYGSLTIKHKAELEEFSRTFSDAVEIILLLLLGLIVSFPLSSEFFALSLLVFAAYLVIRHFAVFVVLREHNFTAKERCMVTSAAPKGIVVAVLAMGALFTDVSLLPLLQIVVACILYSQLLSWLMHIFKVDG